MPALRVQQLAQRRPLAQFLFRKLPEIAERAIVHPDRELRVENQHAVFDRIQHHLPFAQILVLDLHGGIAKHAERIRHPADFVVA